METKTEQGPRDTLPFRPSTNGASMNPEPEQKKANRKRMTDSERRFRQDRKAVARLVWELFANAGWTFGQSELAENLKRAMAATGYCNPDNPQLLGLVDTMNRLYGGQESELIDRGMREESALSDYYQFQFNPLEVCPEVAAIEAKEMPAEEKLENTGSIYLDVMTISDLIERRGLEEVQRMVQDVAEGMGRK